MGSGARSRLRRYRAAPAGCKASGLGRQVDVDADVFSSCFQKYMSPIVRHRLVSDVVHGRCTSLAPLGTNSCGVGHGNSFGAVHDNSCSGVHANSSGTYTYGNSRVERGHDGCGRTKPLSTSARCHGRLAVKKLALLQQVSRRVHEETWAGCKGSLSLKISQEVEIVPECAVTCPTFHLLSLLLCYLGQAGMSGTCWVGHRWGKQQGWGYGCSGVPCKERSFSSLIAAGDLVKKGSYHTA